MKVSAVGLLEQKVCLFPYLDTERFYKELFLIHQMWEGYKIKYTS